VVGHPIGVAAQRRDARKDLTVKALLALAAVTLCATSALAGTPTSGAWRVGADSYHIYYADLDVKTASGRAELLARAEKVADRLCDGMVRRDKDVCISNTIAGSTNPDIQRALAERATVASR
jgi:UrcA family protein